MQDYPNSGILFYTALPMGKRDKTKRTFFLMLICHFFNGIFFSLKAQDTPQDTTFFHHSERSSVEWNTLRQAKLEPLPLTAVSLELPLENKLLDFVVKQIEIKKILFVELVQEKKQAEPHRFVKLQLGNYAAWQLEAFAELAPFHQDWKIEPYLYTRGTLSGEKDSRNSSFSQTDFSLNQKIKLKEKLHLQNWLQFRRQAFGLYGYRLGSEQTPPDWKSIRQVANSISLIQDFDKTFSGNTNTFLRLKGNYFVDNPKKSKQSKELTGGLILQNRLYFDDRFKWLKERFLHEEEHIKVQKLPMYFFSEIDLESNLSRYAPQTLSLDSLAFEQQRSFNQFSLLFGVQNKRWTAAAGGQVVYRSGFSYSENTQVQPLTKVRKWHFFPQLRLSYLPLALPFYFYAKSFSSSRMLNLEQLSAENPYYAFALVLPEVMSWRNEIGTKIGYSKSLSPKKAGFNQDAEVTTKAQFEVAYERFENLPLWVQHPQDTTTFSLITDRAQLLALSLEAEIQLSNLPQLLFWVNSDLLRYNLEDQERAWYRPNWIGELGVKYQFSAPLEANLTWRWQAGRYYKKGTQVEKLADIHDLNLSLRYHLAQKWTLLAGCNNILGLRREDFWGYDRLRWQAFVGAKYTF
jgi:hypothetical protein